MNLTQYANFQKGLRDIFSEIYFKESEIKNLQINRKPSEIDYFEFLNIEYTDLDKRVLEFDSTLADILKVLNYKDSNQFWEDVFLQFESIYEDSWKVFKESCSSGINWKAIMNETAISVFNPPDSLKYLNQFCNVKLPILDIATILEDEANKEHRKQVYFYSTIFRIVDIHFHSNAIINLNEDERTFLIKYVLKFVFEQSVHFVKKMTKMTSFKKFFKNRGLSLKIERKQDTIILVMPTLLLCFEYVYNNWEDRYKEEFEKKYKRRGRRKGAQETLKDKALKLQPYYEEIRDAILNVKDPNITVREQFLKLKQDFSHIEMEFTNFSKHCEKVTLNSSSKSLKSKGAGNFNLFTGEFGKKMRPNTSAIYTLLEEFAKLAFPKNPPSHATIKKALVK